MPATASTRPRAMQLTPAQLRPLWPLLDAAWRQHCADVGQEPADSKAKEAWRHEQLWAALEVRSLKEVRRSGEQYARLMAHFEVIARAGIHWQMQAEGAEIRPLVFGILDLLKKWGIDERYFMGIARQALRLPELPALDQLKPAQLLTLRQLLHGEAAKLRGVGNVKDDGRRTMEIEETKD